MQVDALTRSSQGGAGLGTFVREILQSPRASANIQLAGMR